MALGMKIRALCGKGLWSRFHPCVLTFSAGLSVLLSNSALSLLPYRVSFESSPQKSGQAAAWEGEKADGSADDNTSNLKSASVRLEKWHKMTDVGLSALVCQSRCACACPV